MKNLIKIFSLLLIVTCFTSCDKNDDLKFKPQNERGWVQFLENSPNVIGAFQGAEITVDLDVNIQVPTTSSDLTINYDMVSVSGLDPNSVFSNDGNLITPAGLTSYAGPDNNSASDYSYLNKITLDLGEAIGAVLTEPMVFDVVLTGTSSSIITAGLSGETFKISQRIVINQSLDGFVGTYDVAEQFTGGPNAPLGLGDFFGESYQVELARMSGDASASKFVITNSAGFDTYFFDGTELTFGGDGTLFFDDGFSTDGSPVVALFEIATNESTSFDYDTFTLTLDGPLGPYGPYQFVLTKQ